MAFVLAAPRSQAAVWTAIDRPALPAVQCRPTAVSRSATDKAAAAVVAEVGLELLDNRAGAEADLVPAGLDPDEHATVRATEQTATMTANRLPRN